VGCGEGLLYGGGGVWTSDSLRSSSREPERDPRVLVDESLLSVLTLSLTTDVGILEGPLEGVSNGAPSSESDTT
jgi:hypothetical protein